MTKFVPDPIGILNSTTWRTGHPFFNEPEVLKKNIFFTADINGFQFQPLPDELTGIKQNIQAMEYLNKPSNLFSYGEEEKSTKIEEEKTENENIMMACTRSQTSATKISNIDKLESVNFRILPNESFDPSYKPCLDYVMEKEFYEDLIDRKSDLGKLFLIIKGILLFIIRTKIKARKIKLEDIEKMDIDKEAWIYDQVRKTFNPRD